jgi:Cu-processing system ATP-binding protein
MITFSSISKRFGALQVLQQLQLHIPGNQVTALVGPNAAGKSTVIKLLLGLVRPDAGTISFNGQQLRGEAAYRREIGYMPQSACFPENLDGAHVLRLLRKLRPEATADETLIDEFGIRGELGKPIRTLSGGTRQKLNAAAAFLFATAVLVLDEPTAGLDPLASAVLKDRILRDRSAGRTIVLTSHNTADLEELADRIIFMLDGAARFAGTPDELRMLTGEPRLDRAFAVLMQRGSEVNV